MLLENINYDLKENDLSIIIWENWTWKSLILKLIYFFESSKETVISLITKKLNSEDNLKKIDCNKKLITKFQEIFTSLDIHHKFEVSYTYSWEINWSIHINNKSKSINVFIDETLRKAFKEIDKWYIRKYKKTLDEINSDDTVSLRFKSRFTSGEFKLLTYELSDKFIFIPTWKFTYSIIENYIYNLLEYKENSYDYFLKDFWKLWQSFRNKFVNDTEDPLLIKFFTSDHSIKNISKEKKLQKIIFTILRWTLLKDEEGLKIRNNREWVVRINNASSWQQEILPLLFVIYFEALRNKYDKLDKDITFLIEEPESHLHPKSQKELIEFLDAIYQYAEWRIKFIINTHSPYILEVVNYTFLKNKQTDDNKWIKNGSIFELVGGKLKNLITQDWYLSSNEMSKLADTIENDIFSIDIK